MRKTIELPVGDIVVTLGEPDSDKQGCYLSGKVCSNLKVGPEDQDPEEAKVWNAGIDVLESLVLAHACAGVDVTSPAYIEGLEAVLDAISNNL